MRVGRPRLTKEEFVKKARLIHGPKYDYKYVEYKTNKDKVDITCPEHGLFKQSPNQHLAGCGCPACYRERRRAGHTTNNKQ